MSYSKLSLVLSIKLFLRLSTHHILKWVKAEKLRLRIIPFWNIFIWQTVKAEDYFSGIPRDDDIELSFNPITSVVPKTLGSMPTATDETCLIIITANDRTHSTALSFILKMQNYEVFQRLLHNFEYYIIFTLLIHWFLGYIFAKNKRVLCYN